MGTGRHRYSCYHLDHRHFFIFSQGGVVVSWRETHRFSHTFVVHITGRVCGWTCCVIGGRCAGGLV